MKQILVAGGAGFIGSHLVDKLKKMQFKVIILDNLSSGNYINIENMLNENTKFIEGDIIDLHDIKCDYIFNLASRASPKDFENKPIEILRSNSIGMQNLLELAKKNKAKILQTSTSEVYGDPKISPQNENYYGNVNPTGIRSCYDEGKRFAEALCFAYIRKYDLSVRVARIFNTFGPNMAINDGRVIPNFINQAILGKDITIYGDGSQTRSFCYVDDMVDGLVKLMFKEDKYVKGEIFNIGNNEEITIKELAKEILKITNSESKLIFLERPADDPMMRCPDISKAIKYLNWKPKTNRGVGLRETIKFFEML